MSQYFDNDTNIESNPRFISYELKGKSFTLKTDNGVFSKNKLDQGTYIFLKVLCSLDLGKNLLDLGCCYGAVGLTLASLVPTLNVVCSDVNTRALALCVENAQKLGLSNRVACLQSDIYEKIEGKFDSIAINPPIRAGKKVTYAMYHGAVSRLIDGGSLYIVIRKQQGALSARDYLETLFEKVEVLERDKGYFVIKATKAMNEK